MRLARAVSRRDLLKLTGGAVAAGAWFGVSGCSALGGSQQNGNSQVEKPKLRVGALPACELAVLHLAVRDGHFQEQGLDVEIVNAPDGGAALAAAIGGDYDLASSSYLPIFRAQARGVAQLKIVSHCASAVPDSLMIMASPGSGVREVQDLAGKRIAISGAGTISELMVKAVMRAHGVDFDGVQWVPIGFPNMPQALQANEVDAAQTVEPFTTLSVRNVSAIPVADVATGLLEELPLSGFVANARFAEENPRTVAAFQRAMDSAAAAAQDRSKVVELLPEFTKIDPDIGPVITLPKLESRISAADLQRVVRLMRDFGYVDEELDVAGMVLEPQEG